MEPTSYEASVLKQNWPEEADEWTPVPNVEFIVADRELLQVICQKYDLETNYERMRDHSGAILFLPDTEKEETVFEQGINYLWEVFF
ncbi:MAG: hypothetical protein ACLTZM_09010 [Ruminococcus sp.]